MSKKILKRSLALGALMAFVITGSAFAEVNTSDYDTRVNQDGFNWSFSNDVTNEGVKNYEGYHAGQIYVDMNGKNWDINYDGIGIDAYTNASGHKIIDGGQLKITTSGMGIFFRGGSNEINVDSLIVDSGNFGIQASGNTSITARVIEIESGKASIYAGEANSNVTVSAGELLKITSDVAVRANIGNEIIVGSQNDDKKADIIINGDIDTLDNGKVDVKLETKASVLNGKMNAYSDEHNDNPNRNLTLANGATWNVKGVSDVTTLSGEGGNIIVNDITEEQVAVGTDNTKKLTVAAAANATGITGDAEKDLEALSKTVVAGAEKKAAADTAKITGGSVYDEVSAEIKQDGTLGNVNKEVAAANVSVNDMAAIGLMSWRAEMNDMNKRMGELRNANGEHGVWVRMVRGESEYNSVKNQYNQYQLGYDEKLSVDKRWTVGVALSYTDAENNFAQGTGESTNKALSIYGSKLNDDGTFIDLIAKYARLENDFTTYSGQGAGEYDANGYSFSAEFGKRIQQGKGLWIEPQVELTYGKVGSAEYVTEKGVNVAQDSMESLVGRVGFSLGKDIEKGNVYARASYLYDFDGETKATLNNDAVLENDLGGGWWEVGVGANINLSKATYIYADIEKTFGGEVDTNWQWNLGVRYSF